MSDRKGRSTTRRTPIRIVVRIEEPKWRDVDIRVLRRAARRALSNVRRGGELTILLATDERLRLLNERFRRKMGTTNVLSFPGDSERDGYLGDVAIAYGAASAEARLGRKPLTHHAVHLAVHGVLHLVGYDHKRAKDARVMEGVEVTVLDELGIRNPYVEISAAE